VPRIRDRLALVSGPDLSLSIAALRFIEVASSNDTAFSDLTQVMARLPERKVDPPECPACKRTMRLVGRESISLFSLAELLTFECECGPTIAMRTDQ
jgi:hypothetical protein